MRYRMKSEGNFGKEVRDSRCQVGLSLVGRLKSFHRPEYDHRAYDLVISLGLVVSGTMHKI
jgi:hypothetical protein